MAANPGINEKSSKLVVVDDNDDDNGTYLYQQLKLGMKH